MDGFTPSIRRFDFPIQMTGKGWRALAGTIAAGALVGACEKSDDSGYFGATERPTRDQGTLYINNSAEPEFLDPGNSNDTSSSTLISQMFEGLTSYDPRDGHPVQGVATHWDQS